MPERPASPKLRKKPPIPPYAGVVGIGGGGTFTPVCGGGGVSASGVAPPAVW
jgi:hypothetical protein